MSKYKKKILIAAILLGLVIINIGLFSYINSVVSYQKLLKKINQLDVTMERFRSMEFEEDSLEKLIELKGTNYADPFKNITVTMMLNDYTCDKKGIKKYLKLSKRVEKDLLKTPLYDKLYKRYVTILKDIQYFPVLEDKNKNYKVSFENSWNAPRTYGGKRGHEGTDIMASVNKRGIYPVVSVSDGVIENKGWLEQGGYRIGVRSESGAYFYYAHLYSYAPDVEIGDTVCAGQLLGFMGDTGYSKIEGATGNFDVHLHFGIYYMENEDETSVNPYYILKYLEDYKLSYSYKESSGG